MSSPEPARVLIVEDAGGIAHALQRVLGAYQDGLYQVESCASTEIALRRLYETSFDLLVSDLRLPGMDGLELIRRARMLHPAMRMILITAFGSAEVEEEVRSLGSEYLPKPFHLKDLLLMVSGVLSEPARMPTPVSAWPGLEAGQPGPAVIGAQESKRKNPHWIVLACDLDGTLIENDRMAPETWEALRAARLAGLVFILVTGRTLDRLRAEFPFEELCEAIVAENGAAIYFPHRNSVILPFGQLAPALLQRLEAMNVPLERGMAVASTVTPHDEAVLRLVREYRSGVTVEYNRGAVMLLPVGTSKGNGLLAALRELGYSAHNVVACGDAENDQSLFEAAELGVAVANAQPGLKPAADILLTEPDGAGVRGLIRRLIEGQTLEHRARAGRSLLLGYRQSGVPLYLDPFLAVESSLGIFGSSGSGKSWLAGLLVEELLRHGYQICVIDSEGDYRSLGVSPGTILLGEPGKPLPAPTDVIEICEVTSASLILDLSSYPMEERIAYTARLLEGLDSLRMRRGRPHCILVDEIHNFCPVEGGVLTELFHESILRGGYIIVSYRLSQLSAQLLESLGYWVLTRMRLPEELRTLQPYIERYEGGKSLAEQLPMLPRGQAYLCSRTNRLMEPAGSEVIRFRAGARVIPHIRHLHKYLRAPLPEWKRFYFQAPGGSYLGRSAANLWEFRELLNEVPLDSLRYHMERGDIERWLRQVLHDDELAQSVHKVNDRNLQGEELRRAVLVVVVDRYEELEALI